MQQENKTYIIDGKEYRLKERYSLKDWGVILKIVSTAGEGDGVNSVIMLLAEGRIKELLNVIFQEAVECEIYEEDFEEVSRAINDFFSRKKSLMKNTRVSSQI